jgi:serine palmitoyltransferase
MADAISEAFWNLLRTTGQVSQQVPGLDVVVRYVQRSYQNDPIRVLLEVLLFAWAMHYILKRSEKDTTKLTEKVIRKCR